MNDPEFQKLVPYLPLLAGVAALQLIVWILLANSIRKLLLHIKIENRMMPPNQAFFMVVPLLNIYWNFVVVRNVRDSLNNEFYDRQVAIEESPTQNEGNIFAWSYLIGNLPLPLIGYIASMGYIIGIIIYWRKIIAYKKLLVDLDDDNMDNVEASTQ